MQSWTLLLILLSIAATSAQGQNQTVTSLSAAPPSANLGQAVTLTAAVSPSNASGTITFYDGAAILGVAHISNGSASLVTIGVGYGNRPLTARYGGDSNHAGSLSPPFAEHIVTKAGGTLVSGTGTAYMDSSLALAPLADLNHDGNADLVATGSSGYNPGSVWVYLGNGDGTFRAAQSYFPNTSSFMAAVADIDMDGNPDLLVTGPAGLTSLIGKGDGTFTTGSTILDATDLYVVRVADINADGKPDVLLLRSTSPAVEILFGNGDGTFQTNAPVMLPLSSPPTDLLVADFNGDGIPDLALALPGSNNVTVFLGTGPGTFSAPVAYTSYGASTLNVGDLNNDGKLDLVVGSETATFDLLLGNGDGTFGPPHSVSTYEGPPQTIGTYPIPPYDFDGDGNADVITANTNGDLFVLLGNGDGTFKAPLQFLLFGLGASLVAGDLNRDGIADLVANGSPPAIQPWLGALSPIFTLTASPNPPMLGQSVTLTATCNFLDATGTLTFENIENTGTPLGTAQLVNGGATLPLGQLATGPYIIHATYSGDSKYAPTNLPPLYLEVQQSIGTLLFSASPNPALPGQPITMTATVPINAGNAVISFFDGTTLLTAQTLYSQTATFTTTLAAGVHQLTALFPPYFGYLPTSASVVENVLATPGGVLVAGPSYELSPSITQAIALDLNGDGLPDLAVLDPGKSQVSVLLNAGQGIFQSPAAMPLGFVPGAIVATGFYYPYATYSVTDPAGNAVHMFGYDIGNVPVGQQPVAIAAADFDGDGKVDLVTANAISNNVSLILSSAVNPVSLPVGNLPIAVVAGDFNHDGKSDFAIANRDDKSVMVFLGNGDGTFKPPITTSVGSDTIVLVAGDLNGDFKTDLVVVDGASNQVMILLSNGDGTFRTSATYALGSTPSAAVLADMNGDSKLDLAIATASALLVFSGNGDGTFGAPVTFTQYAGAASVVAAAFSGDGRMDLAVTLPGASSVSLIINGQPTTTALLVSPSSATMSAKVTLKATIAPAGAIGSVAFYDGVTPIGGAQVVNSTASFSTALLLPGVHSLSARFTGGPGYGTSFSSSVGLAVSAVRSSSLSGPTRQTFPFDSPLNLIPGDFNNDGIEDFAFWRVGNGLRVLLGNGAGAFQELPAGVSAGGAPAVTADFNNDGNTDIAYINGVLIFAKGDGHGGFVESTVMGTGSSIATADFNGDGKADIAIANPAGTADVLLGIGDGTFQTLVSYAAGPNPVLVAAGDFSEDGKPDLIVANYIPGPSGSAGSGELNFLPGNGNGAFGAPQFLPIAGDPVSVALADFNGDGHLDVAMVEAGTNTATILLGKGDGTFNPPITFALGATPLQVLAADIDGDGHPDLVVMFSSAAPAFAIFYGNGDGTFAAPVDYSDVQAPSAIAVGDVNGDGSLDVILAESDTVNVFLGIPVVVSPSSVFLDATSQASAVTVTASAGYSWTAAATGGFIGITSGASGAGNGTVNFTVTANGTGAARTGTLTIGRQSVPVTQRETSEVFTDVPPPAYYFDFADVMYTANITAGCSVSPLEYCPDSDTSRGEMAVFLITAIEHGNSFTYTTTPYFTDVPPGNPDFKFIQKLKDLGITGGCTATTYCPDDPVTRGEMAVFIIVSRYETTPYTYPSAPYFTDVPPSNPFFPFIQKMAQTGITAGCAPGLYCPDETLTRGQMAVFIVTGLLNELLAVGTPAIASAAPNSATPGQILTVTLTGVNTHFAQGTTQVVAPAGVAASNIAVLSATSLTVQLTVGAGVVPNPTSVVVLTGTEEAVLPNGFVIQ